jgi:NTE family protein
MVSGCEHPVEMEFARPDVLVLGAGGIVGEAWMGGMLAGLQEGTGFDARGCDHFVGTSAGSIVAAALAAGVDPRTRLDRIPAQPAESPTTTEQRSLLGGALRVGRTATASAFAPLAALALRSTAPGGAAVRRAALGRVPQGERSLADLGRAMSRLHVEWDGRLLVVAVELETGRRVVCGAPGERRLSVAEAVQASCAIPGVFRPLRSGGHTYVDGGTWSLTNLDVAPVTRGAHVLCLNPTGGLSGSALGLRGTIGALSRSVAAVESLVLQRRGAKVTILAPDSEVAREMGGDFMDPSRRGATQEAAFAQGLRAARALSVAA